MKTAIIDSPIEVIPSEHYLLVIKDSKGITHYWHKEHINEYGEFKDGEYDGWSKECRDCNK